MRTGRGIMGEIANTPNYSGGVGEIEGVILLRPLRVGVGCSKLDGV